MVRGLGWTPQVKKYLSYRQGHVAYLTTQASRTPDVNSRHFLGHFFFEDLYQRLDRKRLTATGQLFMDFMKENEMKPLEPFTSTELTAANGAFDFAKKCERRELERAVTAMEQQIQEMESREVDAEIIQRNLANISEALQRLPPYQRKELMALLLREVVYAEKDSKIKLILRPLPDLGWEVEGDRISFDERQTWLRETDDIRTWLIGPS